MKFSVAGRLAFEALMVIIVALIALPKAIGLALMQYALLLPAARLNDGGPADLQALAKATKEALDKIGQQVKEQGEKALAEAKRFGDMYAADKPKVDEVLAKQGELMARLLELEQKQTKLSEQAAAAAAPKTAGQIVTAAPEFKAWLDAGGMKSTSSGFVCPVPRAALLSIDTTNTTTVGVSPDYQQGVVAAPNRRLTIRDLLMPGRTGSNMIQFTKETGFTNNAAPQSEGDTKAESSLTFELTQSAVTTIAHFLKASKQILDDWAQLQSYIDGRLRYGLKYKEETQLLSGSGVGNNLNGIYTQATAYAAPIAPHASPTKIDIIRLMLLQAELAEYPADGIVLHPSDWTMIELTKDANRNYVFANPHNASTPVLWGRNVVATQAMTVDTALVGSFMLGAQIFDREDANVVISTENSDDFVRNLITIRCEERLALAVYRPAAFIKNTNLVAS